MAFDPALYDEIIAAFTVESETLRQMGAVPLLTKHIYEEVWT